MFIVHATKRTLSSARSEMYLAHKWACEYHWFSWAINISCVRHEDH